MCLKTCVCYSPKSRWVSGHRSSLKLSNTALCLEKGSYQKLLKSANPSSSYNRQCRDLVLRHSVDIYVSYSFLEVFNYCGIVRYGRPMPLNGICQQRGVDYDCCASDARNQYILLLAQWPATSLP